MKKTLMIFGISSFVGSNLAEALGDEYRIIGTYHKTPVELPGVLCVPCDVLKKDFVYGVVSRLKPDVTIYAVGLSDLYLCKASPKLAEALNTAGAVNCSLASEREGAKFVFLSSAYVHSGADQLFREGDVPFPTSAYGQSLSSSEYYIQRSCLNYFILRCSELYGRSHNPLRSTWFESLQASFFQQRPVEVDDSVTCGFLDVQLLARILRKGIENNVTNRLYQISSRDFMTRYEFSRLYAKVFHEDESLLLRTNKPFPAETGGKGSQKGTGPLAFKLDTANASDFLGLAMPSIEESLTYTKRSFEAKTSEKSS